MRLTCVCVFRRAASLSIARTSLDPPEAGEITATAGFQQTTSAPLDVTSAPQPMASSNAGDLPLPTKRLGTVSANAMRDIQTRSIHRVITLSNQGNVNLFCFVDDKANTAYLAVTGNDSLFAGKTKLALGEKPVVPAWNNKQDIALPPKDPALARNTRNRQLERVTVGDSLRRWVDVES